MGEAAEKGENWAGSIKNTKENKIVYNFYKGQPCARCFTDKSGIRGPESKSANVIATLVLAPKPLASCFFLFPLPPSTCIEVCDTGRLGAEAVHEAEATYLAAAKTKLQKTQLSLKTHQAGATPPLQLP